MKINAVELKNFKRFTHLMISGIPSTAKLILLIGANGSGKSSLFDAFSWIAQGIMKSKLYNTEDTLYYHRKNIHQAESVRIELDNNQVINMVGDLLSNGRELVNRFIGRSSNIIV